jgi:hypothetical protein
VVQQSSIQHEFIGIAARKYIFNSNINENAEIAAALLKFSFYLCEEK